MIAQKRLPPLRRRPPVPCHILGDRRLADVDAKLEQLAMDPRRSPERVGKADVTDQFADVRRQLRTAARRSRLPSPVKAKTRAVPADYSFWLNNRQGAQHVRCQTIQSGEYQPIELAECRPLRRFTSQDVQLMAQHQDLCLQRDPRLEKPDQRTPDRFAALLPFAIWHPPSRMDQRGLSHAEGALKGKDASN